MGAMAFLSVDHFCGWVRGQQEFSRWQADPKGRCQEAALEVATLFTARQVAHRFLAVNIFDHAHGAQINLDHVVVVARVLLANIVVDPTFGQFDAHAGPIVMHVLDWRPRLRDALGGRRAELRSFATFQGAREWLPSFLSNVPHLEGGIAL